MARMETPDPTVLPRHIPHPKEGFLGIRQQQMASVVPSLQAQAGVGRAEVSRDRQGWAGTGRDKQGQHSLATGGVHQQSDEGGGGRADTVECQHGVFALLFTHHVI